MSEKTFGAVMTSISTNSFIRWIAFHSCSKLPIHSVFCLQRGDVHAVSALFFSCFSLELPPLM